MYVLFSFCQIETKEIGIEKIYKRISQEQEKQTETKKFLLKDSTVCIVDYKNGLLSGSFKSYYPSGKVKAKGNFYNNNFIDKWKVRNKEKNSSFLVRIYSNNSYKLRRVRTAFLRNPVKFSLGSINYNRVDYVNSLSTAPINFWGSVKIREGKKHGLQQEYYSNGKLKSNLNFNNGVPDGKHEEYYHNGNKKLVGKYSKHIPIGIWQHYNDDGELLLTRDYNEKPFAVRMPSHIFTGQHEIISAQRYFKVYPGNFSVNSTLFEADTNGKSLISIINSAFYMDDIIAYDNYNLNVPYYPTTQKPGISRLDYEKTAKPVMIITTEDYYYSKIKSDMHKVVLCISFVFCYEDENGYTALTLSPWLYFPEIYPTLKDAELHNIKLGDIFDKLMDDRYKSFIIKHQNLNNEFFYEQIYEEDWLDYSEKQFIEFINTVHNEWLIDAGLKN